jgi:AraC-like DNA-binding protein
MTPEQVARHLLRAKDLVNARYSEALTVATLAAAANMSRSHFSHQFTATFGESPHQYLLTRRLERAAALLRTRVGRSSSRLTTARPATRNSRNAGSRSTTRPPRRPMGSTRPSGTPPATTSASPRFSRSIRPGTERQQLFERRRSGGRSPCPRLILHADKVGPEELENIGGRGRRIGGAEFGQIPQRCRTCRTVEPGTRRLPVCVDHVLRCHGG